MQRTQLYMLTGYAVIRPFDDQTGERPKSYTKSFTAFISAVSHEHACVLIKRMTVGGFRRIIPNLTPGDVSFPFLVVTSMSPPDIDQPLPAPEQKALLNST